MQNDIANVRRVLQYSLGATAVAAGADKFFDLLTDWDQYLNPRVPELTGLTPRQFMRIVGVIEIAAGLGLLSGYKRSGGYIVSLWILGIAGNLLTQGRYLDIAVRDINMAIEAFALARLSALEQEHAIADSEITRAELAA
jgi:hypothetical protein